MARVAFLGNCQSLPMQALTRSLCNDVTVIEMPPVHLMKPKDLLDAVNRCEQADVIIHQPLGGTFGPIASTSLRAALPNKTFVSFPSIYFGGLFPQLTYLRQPDGPVLWGPINDYHDARIIAAYLASESTETCLERVLDDDPAMISFFEKAFEDSVEKERGCDIKSMDVMMSMMPSASPLYTFNHPQNAVLWAVIERTFQHAGLGLPDGTPVLPEREFLSNTRAAIPNTIPKNLGHAWRRPEYSLWEDAKPMPDLIKEYYELYDTISDFAALCRHNAYRFNIEVKIPD